MINLGVYGLILLSRLARLTGTIQGEEEREKGTKERLVKRIDPSSIRTMYIFFFTGSRSNI